MTSGKSLEPEQLPNSTELRKAREQQPSSPLGVSKRQYERAGSGLTHATVACAAFIDRPPVFM